MSTPKYERTTKTFDELLQIAKDEGVKYINYFDMNDQLPDTDDEGPAWHFDVYGSDPHKWHHWKVVPRFGLLPILERWYYDRRIEKGDSKLKAFFKSLNFPIDFWFREITWTTYGHGDPAG